MFAAESHKDTQHPDNVPACISSSRWRPQARTYQRPHVLMKQPGGSLIITDHHAIVQHTVSMLVFIDSHPAWRPFNL